MDDVQSRSISDGLSDKDILIVNTSTENLEEVNNELLKYIGELKDKDIIYVTVGRPYLSIADEMDEKGIDSDQIFFIDCSNDVETSDEDNCICIRPQALTDISIAINQTLKRFENGRDKVLVFNSLNMLSLYTDDKIVEKFAHSIIGKLREMDVNSILVLTSDSSDTDLTGDLSQLADGVMDFPE